jgi:outer membrane protein OmpA-like peptidoglycan-associated protein
MKKLFVFLFAAPFLSLAQTTVMTEHFDAPSTSWPQNDNGAVNTVFKNGTMVMDAYHEGYMNFTSTDYRIDLGRDFTIETRLKFVLGIRSEGYGFAWGYRSWENYNGFFITPQGNAAIIAMDQNEPFMVMDWTEIKKKILKQETEYNVLRIEKKGGTIYFQINGNEIYNAPAKNFKGSGTQQGFMVRSNMKLVIDELSITSSENKINLVENPVNGFKLENLGTNINSSESDRSPIISPDGKTLYFVSERSGGLGLTDIWQSTLDSSKWGMAVNSGSPLNNAGHNFVVSVTPDGNTLLVGNTYNADGSSLGTGVSIAVKRNGEWSVPVEQRIDGYVNRNQFSSFFLTPDGTRLIMALENDESQGDKDFFISSLKEDNTWSKPQRLCDAVNSFGADFAPFLAADGKTLFFASDGRAGYGSSDVYVTKRLDDTWLNWSEPKNLGTEINTSDWEAYYCIPAKGNYAYMVSTGRQDGIGSDDIYRIKVAEDLMPDPVILVSGHVYNKKTGERIEAEISYGSLEDTIHAGRAFSTVKDGFALALPKGNWYGFQARAAGFIPVSENLDLKNLSSYAEKEINLYLVPIEKGQVVRLNNIFFDFGKASLRETSDNELERLVKLLRENPGMKIEIGGHTDNKGSDAFNLQLSNDRARAVADFILSKGIAGERITYKGYGETKPVAGNDTDEGTQMNRRVEFTIR